VSRTIDGEALVVQPQDGMMNVLNDVGALVWESCDGTRTIAEIARLVRAKYDVSEEAALADVAEFVRDLQDKGLVELDPGNGGASADAALV